MTFGLLGANLATVDLLRTYIPACFFLTCTGIVWCFALLNLWKPTRTLFEFLGRPFWSFLTLDDIAEYETSIKPPESPSIEIKSLRILCFIQAAGWTLWTVLSVVERAQLVSLAGLVLLALSWVREYYFYYGII
jgi:hypothetical protein